MYGLIDVLQEEARRANRWRRVALIEFGLIIGAVLGVVLK